MTKASRPWTPAPARRPPPLRALLCAAALAASAARDATPAAEEAFEAAAGGAGFEAALAADEECLAGSTSHCSVSALQLRAKKAGASGEGLSRGASSGGASEGGLRACLQTAAPRRQSARAGAETLFDCHAERAGLVEELAPDELQAFRARFALRASALLEDGSQLAADVQAREAARLLREQGPALTRKFVDQVKKSASGWTVGAPGWLDNLTNADLPALGGHIDDPRIPDITNDLRARSSDKALPERFDSRERWRKCADVIGHVRDQGMCSSCWAQAAASTLDGRVCVASGGNFSGPRAWTSAGYFASCYNVNNNDGCSGGNVGWTLQQAAGGGVPTGSDSDETCVPYFGKGSFFDYIKGEVLSSPPCPTACTSSKPYPRPLSADKFYPSHQMQTSRNLVDFKRELVERGPMPMSFDVYRDFLLYLGGHYDHSFAGQDVVYKHATTAIGYERHQGKDYIISVNSWGKMWGHFGVFKMQADCCNVLFYLPGAVEPAKQALPLPGPGPNCERRTGGTCILFGCGHSRGPTTCSWAQCYCRPGYCSIAGSCVRQG